MTQAALHENSGVVHEGLRDIRIDGGFQPEVYSASYELPGAQAGAYLSAVAVRHGFAESTTCTGRGEPVRTIAENTKRVIEQWLAPESAIAPVVRVLGITGARQQVDGVTHYAVTFPNQPEVANARYEALGITDRRVVGFDGGVYPIGTGVLHTSKNELVVASQAPHHLHDRLIHYPAHALLPPSVLDAVAGMAKRGYGTSSLRSTMSRIDMVPGLVVALRNPDPVEAKGTYAAGLMAVFGYGNPPLHYAEEAIEWRDELVRRAQNLA